MRVGLFATGGYTEVGGLQRVLERWLPGVQITRCLPTAQKGRKLDPLTPSPAPNHNGLTGEALIREAISMVSMYHAGDRCGFDVLVLADDADCRFGCETKDGWEGFVEQVTERFRAAAQRPDLPVVVLLASPEVEAWLVADFDNGFGDAHFLASCFDNGAASRGAVQQALSGVLKRPWREVEAFGCPPHNGSCSSKLSTAIGGALSALNHSSHPYSKWKHGALMLQRVDPERLVNGCPLYAGPALRRLRVLQATME